MKMAIEIDSITIPFSNLAKGETYREENYKLLLMASMAINTIQ